MTIIRWFGPRSGPADICRPMVAQMSEMSAKSAIAVFAGMLVCRKSEMSAIALFPCVFVNCGNKCSK